MSTDWTPLPTFGPHDDSDKPRLKSCAYLPEKYQGYDVITPERLGQHTRQEVDQEVIRLQRTLRDVAIALGIAPCPSGEYRFYRDFAACVMTLLELSDRSRLK